MQRIFKYLILIVLLAVNVSYAGEVGRGGTAGSFLRMGAGARALGMGGGGLAAVEDACAIYYNPANLVFLQSRTVTGSLQKMALDRSLSFVGFAMPLGSREGPLKPGQMNAGFGIGWLSAAVDNIDSRDFNGDHIEMLSHSNHAFYFSFAMQPGPQLALGVSGKVLYSRFPGMADNGLMYATGFGFDLGLLFRLNKHVSLGGSLRDLRSKYTWDSQKLYERGTQTVDKLPKVLRLGLAVRDVGFGLLFTADMEKVDYSPAYMMAGIAWQPMELFTLRFGLNDNRITAGAGIRIQKGQFSGQLDYAYVPDTIAPGDNHVMTWSVLF